MLKVIPPGAGGMLFELGLTTGICTGRRLLTQLSVRPCFCGCWLTRSRSLKDVGEGEKEQEKVSWGWGWGGGQSHRLAGDPWGHLAGDSFRDELGPGSLPSAQPG